MSSCRGPAEAESPVAQRDCSDVPIEVTVVVAAFNELQSVELVIEGVRAELTRLAIPGEILVIDDGSTDGTQAIVSRLASTLPEVRCIRHESNCGLGAVYRTGLQNASGRFVTFMPADGQFPASNLAILLSAARDQDAVFGYLETRRDGMVAALLSLVERAMYRLVVGPMPRFQGLLIIRTDVLAGIRLTSTGRGWGIIMELVARLYQGGYRTTSVLTEVVPREHGRSKVRNLRTITANLRDLSLMRGNLRRSAHE
jgi:glycosyltransferase involved in cell wall biosynthesis